MENRITKMNWSKEKKLKALDDLKIELIKQRIDLEARIENVDALIKQEFIKCDVTCICKGKGVVWEMVLGEPEKEPCPYQAERYLNYGK